MGDRPSAAAGFMQGTCEAGAGVRVPLHLRMPSVQGPEHPGQPAHAAAVRPRAVQGATLQGTHPPPSCSSSQAFLVEWGIAITRLECPACPIVVWPHSNHCWKPLQPPPFPTNF